MKRGESGLSLVIGVDKPSGMTSHDVVNRCRRIFGEKRVGHTGTLDPLASGVLPICIGPAARLGAYLTGHDKAYRATIAFGVGTDTDDCEGAVTRTAPVPVEVGDRAFAEQFVAQMVGPQKQLPPAYSAIKVNGKKSYSTMRGVAKTLYNQRKDVEIIGFIEGYRGLIYEDYRIMKSKDFSGILTNGGTILGTSRQPFKLMRVPDENGLDKVEAMKNTYKKLKLDCLVVLGGNGSQKTTNLLRQEGLNVIGLPKTIDNDLWGTDVTFGFQSAINLATQTIDCIHTTAASHGRVFIVEIMGHKVGWLTLHAGIAGGADIILVPEIPYDINKVAAAVNKRAKEGKRFSIIAVAEGAISKEQAALSKKEYKKYIATRQYPSISYEIGAKISELTGQEVRVAVPGHMQRGGSPCPYDRVLSTRLGAAAGKMILDGEFGYLVGMKNNHIAKIPLADVAGKLKMIQPDDEMVQEAKLMGISFGD